MSSVIRTVFSSARYRTRTAVGAVSFLFAAGAQALASAMDTGEPPSGIDKIAGPETTAEVVLDGFKEVDGPVFSRHGFWLFSDAGNNWIWKLTHDESKAELWRKESGGARGLIFDRQGRLLACETGNRRVTRTEKDGAITILADRFEGKRLNGPDDLLHAIDGSTYFTDPATGRLPGGTKFEQPHAAVYQIMRDGTLRAVATDFKAPNGLALTADQRTLYVSDSAANHIRVFSIRGDGRLDGGKVFASMPSGKGEAGGIETDFDGNVYCTGPGGVWVFDNGGRHLGTLPVPGTPSNIGWGDDYRTLYVAAGTVLYKIKLKASGTRIY